jgi:Cof subfamily protein (haloacid dehalogenase superfamily)
VTIRLLASDLDGTLVRSDGTVSDRTRDAVRRATEAGLLVAFVSGRPPRWLHEIADALDHRGVAVAANGAVIYDLRAERVIREHLLTPELLAAITEEVRAAYPAVRFGVEYGVDFGYEPGYRHDWEISPSHDRQGKPLPPPRMAHLSEIITKPAVKLLAKDLTADADEMMVTTSRILAGRATVTHSSRFALLEIAAAGVTKASGLAEVAVVHGIPAADVAAIGDMPNDVPMLEWAGYAYAVGNAHPAAIAAADEVLGRNDDDAVAVLIETLLASRSEC